MSELSTFEIDSEKGSREFAVQAASLFEQEKLDFRPLSDSGALKQFDTPDSRFLITNNTSVREVNLSDLNIHSLFLFQSLDKTNSGRLTRRDLAAALQNPEIKGADAQTLVLLFENIGAIGNAHHITRADLEKFSQRMKTVLVNNELKQNLQDEELQKLLFGSDGKNQITREHLKAWAGNSELSHPARQAVNFTLNNFERISGVNSRTLSAKQLSNFIDSNLRNPHEQIYQLMTGRVNEISRLQSDALNKRLFGSNDPLLSGEIIVPDAIKQGNIGNCYFVSTLAAFSVNNPKAIVDMIKPPQEPGKPYTIVFPGDINNPVYVQAPTEAEMAIYNRGSRYGFWAVLLEKGFGEYLRQNADRLKYSSNFQNARKDHLTPQDATVGTFWSHQVINLLTGKNADLIDMSTLSQEQLQSLVKDAVRERRILTADIIRLNTLSSSHLDKKLVNEHSYAVIDFDPNGKDGGTVVLMNPWNRPEIQDKDAAVFRISLKSFARNFTRLAVER